MQMIKLKKREQLWNQFGYTIEDQRVDQLWNQVRAQLWNQLRDELWDELREEFKAW